MVRINEDFLARDTLVVAKELLGNIFCRKIDDKIYKGIIVETEAYKQEDPACHAYRGITKRSASLFKKPGTVYVYLIYGMYHCVNFVTQKEGYGSGVLIRAIEPLNFTGQTNGPGKLTKALDITKKLDGCDILSADASLWIEYGNSPNSKSIAQTARVGITQGVDLPWRFYLKENKWVSKSRPTL